MQTCIAAEAVRRAQSRFLCLDRGLECPRFARQMVFPARPYHWVEFLAESNRAGSALVPGLLTKAYGRVAGDLLACLLGEGSRVRTPLCAGGTLRSGSDVSQPND